jgi:curved DNA-binding protein CbpA
MEPLRGNHYEVLGLAPRATAEQVERAFEFFEAMYGEGSVATYSLLGPDEAAAARARIQEAHAVLSDPVRRHAYDVEEGFASSDEPLLLFGPPHASSPGPPAGPAQRAETRVLPPPVTGERLKRFREERGVSLHEIAAVTKVSVRYLEYIEADRHGLLPAPVYLKGFLREYARELGLDPGPTVEAYMARLGS